jgi:hypothetical protein
MIKKTVTYTGFDGEKLTKDLYFHLGIKDIIEMEAETPIDPDTGKNMGVEAWVKREVESDDSIRILKVLGKFIDKGYGLRGADDEFEKSQEISDKFGHSLAFDAFFNDMMKDQASAANIIVAMLPADLLTQAEIAKGLRDAGVPDKLVDEVTLPAQKEHVLQPPQNPNELVLSMPIDPETVPAEDQIIDIDFERQREDMLSGLKAPRDAKGELLPWAFREPNFKEKSRMTKPQLLDIMQRKSAGEWEPTVGG